MGEDVIIQALGRYGVRPVRFLSIEKGYRNESHPALLDSGHTVNLIMYKSEPGIIARIRRANAVADFLAGQGFPARRTADSRIIRLTNGERVKYGALYSYLSGKTIPWEAYTQQHIKLLGQTLSDMHAALAVLPRTLDADVTDEYIAIYERMERYFHQPEVAAAITRKLSLTVNEEFIHDALVLIRACKTLPGQQALHMDFVRGNVLFAEQAGEPASITGILDFEKAAQGHPLFDIARTLAFLLVDCKFKTEEKVRKYFLYSGYQKRGAASFRDVPVKIHGQKISLLESLIDIFLFYDFYKFLRHNPYESLKLNAHFVRTKKILVKRKVLSEMVK